MAGDLAMVLTRALTVKIAQTPKERGVEFAWCRFHSIDPAKNLLIRNGEPALKLVELVVLQRYQLRIRKSAEHEIHLANPAMPAAEQQPPPARIQAFAR